MKSCLWVRNVSKRRPLNSRFLKRILKAALASKFPDYETEIGFLIQSDPAIAELNLSFLNHEGPTDVITFDYNDAGQADRLSGEAHIGVEVAVRQAVEFDSHWTEELTRYCLHAILHLAGFDDKEAAARKVMKAHENRWVDWCRNEFDLERIERAD